MTDAKVTEIDVTQPIDPTGRRQRRLVFGLAAAVVALVLGTVAWLVSTDDDGLREAAAAGDPEAVTRVFIDDWTSGDVESAIAWFHPNALIGGIANKETVQSFMDYTLGIMPAGWELVVSECHSATPTSIRCHLALEGDPVADALGLEGNEVGTTLRDGLIEFWNPPSYGQADFARGEYARAADPAGFEQACGSGAGSGLRNNGIVYNGECGTFLGQYSDEVAAQIRDG